MRLKYQRQTGLGRIPWRERPELSPLNLGDLGMAFLAYGVLLGAAILAGQDMCIKR